MYWHKERGVFMEKREQEILEKIEEKTKDVKVPESLMPEKIEMLLEDKGKKSGITRTNLYRIGGPLAACLVLAAGIGIAGNVGRGPDSGNVNKSAAKTAEKVAEDESNATAAGEES